ncbi:MAG TPA: hypothetical protein VFK40_08880 [Nitrososphaeraceae archaeon]|nr:hypothetical protein [Nitrososphaeraceae archaeon]
MTTIIYIKKNYCPNGSGKFVATTISDGLGRRFMIISLEVLRYNIMLNKD